MKPLLTLTAAVSGLATLAAVPATVSAAGDSPVVYEYAHDADVMVFRLPGYEVGGDGTVYRLEPTMPSTDEAPATTPATTSAVGLARPKMIPLPPPMISVASLDEVGMQRLFAAADAAGLLDGDVQPPEDYDWCCDRPARVVTIVLADRTLEHLYPTGESGEGFSPELRALGEFTELDLVDIVGDGVLGEFTPFVPERWLVTGLIPPWDTPVREWPLEATPEIGECVELPNSGATDTASGRYATDDGDVWASPALPWTECAPAAA